MEKMTKKEMFNVIKNAMADNVDVIAFCDNEIALLDKKAAKAKEAAAKKKAEGDDLLEAVYDALTVDFRPIAEITDDVDFPDVTVAKVTYRLTALVKAGRAAKAELVIEGGEGVKSRKVAGYARCDQ